LPCASLHYASLGEGTELEHGKLLLRDPSGHLLEFKAYRELATVLPGDGPGLGLALRPFPLVSRAVRVPRHDVAGAAVLARGAVLE
jgi:hypothetical protein